MSALALSFPKEKSLLKDLLQGIAFSFLVGLAAHLAIPLPFTPVPLLVQAQLVLFFSALLGKRGAFIMTTSFLIEGLIGFPFFAHGFSGPAILMGPTGGYLLGYVAASYLVGSLFERAKEKSPLTLFRHMAIGNGLILLMGCLYLATFTGLSKAFLLGVCPFLLGDALKLVAAAKVYQKYPSMGIAL